jgi:predicted CXXCH cytochrome family protein
MPGWFAAQLERLRAARLPKLPPLPKKATRLAAPLFVFAVGFGIVAMLLMVQLTSTPTFCGFTCHNMKPYYDSWSHSKHNKIACVECHIAPGIGAEVRKKFEALSMVAKYFTGTTGTKPWAEVDDAACMRCHERRLLEGKEVFHNVVFDHTPHLSESRRGLRLRCTSCHSQIVQGSHIAVTSSTCALCHFKNQPLNSGTGACLHCHQVPEKVTSNEGVTFDHSQVSRLDMKCDLCHGGVVRGDGAVPKERCLTCHNEPARLARYDDTKFLHDQHVTQHKVDCQHCHLTIEHGRLPSRAASASHEAAGDCRACHGSGHSPQQDLYAGLGGRGVARMPSPMFAAGVTCQGCHNDAFSTAVASTGPEGPHTQPASAVSCMSCHGPSYGRIFEAWKSSVEARVSALRKLLEESTASMGFEAPPAWEDARANFLLVERGHGIHNVNFAYALLDKSFDQLNEARQARKLSALNRPWKTLAGNSSSCMSCHVGIEDQRGTFAGQPYSHQPHLTAAGLGCESCHRPHAERAPGEVVRFGPDGCRACHHKNVTTVSQVACGGCHGDVKARTYPSFRGEFSHTQHLDTGLECKACHVLASGDPRPQSSACKDCHQ